MKFRRKRRRRGARPDDPSPSPRPRSRPTRPARRPRTEGPFDVSEVDLEGSTRVDLGSLLITPTEGREVRVQVDEATKAVQSVMVAGPDGALELRAFAAPRNGDLWSEVRPQIGADIEGRGGTVAEREGRFGTELVCERPVQLPDGKTGRQASRVLGVNGPRWFLRATLMGGRERPGGRASWEDMLAQVVVRRGDHAMPVADPLPIVLPTDARKLAARLPDRRPRISPCRRRVGLRRSISRWANSADQHARDLRRVQAESGLTTIADAPDRDMVQLQGDAADRHPAAARRRPGPGGRAVRRLRRAHPGLARPAADHRHRAGSVPAGQRPDRRPGRTPDHVQPALRAAAVSPASPVSPSPGAPADVASVEAVVRQQLSTALGGRRGMIEAAVPTLLFTVLWLVTKELRTALVVSVAAALVLLAVRLVQRSTVQFVVNALVGIGIGYVFVTLSARSGGSAEEQALAYFLPGILYNLGYSVVMALHLRDRVAAGRASWSAASPGTRPPGTATARWSGCAPSSPGCWCCRACCAPCVQGPVWLAGTLRRARPRHGGGDPGVLKIGMGWPLQLAALASMVWLLGREPHAPAGRRRRSPTRPSRRARRGRAAARAPSRPRPA